MEIKDVLRQQREELGLSCEECGRRVGVSASTISRWESGDIANMKRDKIAKLAEVLKISPAVIMGWEEPPKNVKFDYILKAIENDGTYEEIVLSALKVKKDNLRLAKQLLDKLSE